MQGFPVTFYAAVRDDGCRHEGIFVVRGKEDSLVTRNMVPGKAVYGEKLIKVDVSFCVALPAIPSVPIL
jgi:hypothetical protein